MQCKFCAAMVMVMDLNVARFLDSLPPQLIKQFLTEIILFLCVNLFSHWTFWELKELVNLKITCLLIYFLSSSFKGF